MEGEIEFPTEGILPKTETGAAQFVQDNPTWDGRGVKVAIFDTGVDPGAEGLQLTCHGLPKIVDVVDCTGSGDVEMSEIRDLKEGETNILGLSGKILKLGSLNCPSRKIFLGIKRVFELFPKPLVTRIQEERLESFKQDQRIAEASVQQQLCALEKDSKKESYKKDKKDLDSVIGGLSDQMEQYSDGGPFMDCVVFYDGSKWRAILDTDCSGDLTSSPHMTDFRVERQISTFRVIPGTKSNSILLNFAVNIYEEGKRLSIVADAGSHGTHVAGIVAANYPGKPALNGIAPGAQIVSCKIGDTRLGSMETITGLVRGLLVAKDNGCDLINLSYGESYMYPNIGRFVELASEFVNRHNIIFVSSAGNNGPALSTVGAPGGTSTAVIGVGAYVSPGMMEVEYSLRAPIPPATNYTWSSRGPALDGFLGVSVCAPGGAIAPVPNWTLQNKQQMNGTSMSSPNCCGGIALILSALKAQSIPYSPHSVRRAIENTAKPVEAIEPFALGHGLLQVGEAHRYLKQFHATTGAHVPLHVTTGKDRGIYLRNWHETQVVKTATLVVVPGFPPDADKREQLAFEMNLSLVATVPWVAVPKQLVLNGLGGVHFSRGFEVEVDPNHNALPPGASLGLIQAFDPACSARGPLFKFPVTVIKADPVPDDGNFRVQLQGRSYSPGTVARHFLEVPADATCAQFTFRTKTLDGSHMIVLHTLQLVPGQAATGRNPQELERYIRLKPHSEVVERVAVRGGLTLEVCLCKWWASLGACVVDAEVEFRAVVCNPSRLTLTPAAPEPVELWTPLRPETLAVSARLTHLRKLLAPTKHAIRPLDPARHMLPEGRQVLELELTYSFEQTEKEALQCQPLALGLRNLLYDSPWEAQMWMLFDSNKQRLGVGDGLHDYPVTLRKGKYTVRLVVRHDCRETLDRLKTMSLAVDLSLAKEINLSVYPTLHAASSGGAKFTSTSSARGARTVVYVTPPTDKAPGAKAGDLLLGQLTVAKWGEFKAEVAVVSVVGKEEEAEEEADEPGRGDAELLAEAVRDAQIGRLKKLREESKWEAFDALAAALAHDHPDHLPLLKEDLLRRAAHADDPTADTSARRARAAAAVRAARAVVRACDPAALAAHFGVRREAEDSGQKAAGKEMDKRKEALVEAALVLVERAAAMLEPPPSRAAADGGGGLDGGGGPADELEEGWALARQWVTPKDAKWDLQLRYAAAASQAERRLGRPGAALAELVRVLKSKEGVVSRRVVEEMRDLAAQMKWRHWQAYYADMLLRSFPATFPLF